MIALIICIPKIKDKYSNAGAEWKPNKGCLESLEMLLEPRGKEVVDEQKCHLSARGGEQVGLKC